MRMTRAQLDRKTAYQIDPLLAASVEISDEPVLSRIDGEIPADHLWKRRRWDRRTRTWVWVPMALIILLVGLVIPPTQASASDRPAVVAVAECPRLKRGSFGPAVVELQARLQSFGWTVKVDGRFGPQTERAVRNFQRVSGLRVDGIVGPRTQRALKCGQSDPVGRWREIALSAGWSAAEWPWLACVIERESGGNPAAYNGSGRDRSYGLTQLNTYGSLWSWYVEQGLTDPTQLLDGYTNLRIAKLLHNRYGTAPWRSSWKPC